MYVRKEVHGRRSRKKREGKMKKKLAAGFYSFLFFYFSSDKHCVIVQL
jgi:hypothetical protein